MNEFSSALGYEHTRALEDISSYNLDELYQVWKDLDKELSIFRMNSICRNIDAIVSFFHEPNPHLVPSNFFNKQIECYRKICTKERELYDGHSLLYEQFH